MLFTVHPVAFVTTPWCSKLALREATRDVEYLEVVFTIFEVP